MKRIGYERAILLLTAAFLALSAAVFLWTGRATQLVRVTTQYTDRSVQPPAQDGGDPPESLLDGEVIDLNTASESDLARLPGIGRKRAQAIVERRQERGTFHSPQELLEIEGIGPGILENILPYVRAGEAEIP